MVVVVVVLGEWYWRRVLVHGDSSNGSEKAKVLA